MVEGDAELERRPAMGAVQVQHAHASAAIAKDHQVLAEDLDSQRRGDEVAGERHRLPEPPQIFPARRPRTHPRQLGIRRRDLAAMIAVEPGGRRPGDTRSSSLHGTSLLSLDDRASQAAAGARY